jgi:hypothetical protein
MHHASAVQEDDSSRGEWYEGRIYYESARDVDKARGWGDSRYQAMRVVWVSGFGANDGLGGVHWGRERNSALVYAACWPLSLRRSCLAT